MEFTELVQRIEVFGERYCRKKPSLGMLGEMYWVLGLDPVFVLTQRPREMLAEDIGLEPMGTPTDSPPA